MVINGSDDEQRRSGDLRPGQRFLRLAVHPLLSPERCCLGSVVRKGPRIPASNTCKRSSSKNRAVARQGAPTSCGIAPSGIFDAREAQLEPERLQEPVHRVLRGVVPGADRSQHGSDDEQRRSGDLRPGQRFLRLAVHPLLSPAGCGHCHRGAPPHKLSHMIFMEAEEQGQWNTDRGQVNPVPAATMASGGTIVPPPPISHRETGRFRVCLEDVSALGEWRHVPPISPDAAVRTAPERSTAPHAPPADYAAAGSWRC